LLRKERPCELVMLSKEFFETLKIQPNKALGQNFLMDNKVVQKLAQAADLSQEDLVVEVGAGLGVLTKELAHKAGKVIALELDPRFIPYLQSELADYPNVELINIDCLKFDFDIGSDPLHGKGSDPYLIRKVVGSIPYQITSPLLHQLLTLESKPDLVVFLIQKEVAEKLTAKPPDAAYLSNWLKFVGSAEIVINHIKPASFWPQPKVESAIIKIIPNKKVSADKARRFSEFLHKAFSKPRKMLSAVFDRSLLEKAGIEPRQRPQEVEFENWLRLFE